MLNSATKPVIKDDAGKRRVNLPKPTAKDDASKANQAIEEWKLLKKQITEVFKQQTKRLEHAKDYNRRWSKDEFEAFLVNHPIMINLVESLLWGCYDNSDKLILTFRVTKDKKLVNKECESFSLDTNLLVGIAKGND